MDQNGKLGAQELNDLSDELATLSKQQSDSRQAEVYIRMSLQEVKDFDERKGRISRIYVILAKHDAAR